VSTLEEFKEEEELRLGLEELGRIHDCIEVGCELDPKGKKIPDEAEGQRRPKPSERLRELWKKYREGELE